MKKIYGLYSEKQRDIAGLVCYSDKDGNKKYVTEVNYDPEYAGYWDDVFKTGELSHFLFRVDNGRLNIAN